MAQNQTVNYRVNIDDADFQAKLSAMRSSIDMTVGASGMGGMGMGYGMAPQSMLGGMANVAMGTGGGMMMSGLADFGTQLRPVSYTPPAIALQPHFGMFQVAQSVGQAAIGMTGPIGMGIAHPFSLRGAVPNNISMADYMAQSTRAFAAHAGDAVATGMLVGGSTAASLAAGGAGSAIGSSLFAGGVGKFVGGFLGGALGGMAVTSYTGEVADMMAENRAVQQQLSRGSFRFISGGPDVDPLTGRGFSREARANIADFVQTQELKDARFGMNEYRQVLESGMQMDLFSGTHDANDFKTKFKALVDNVKTVAATLHTSLQEGVEVIRGFRDMGVTDPNQINRMTMGSELMGRASGHTGMEMMAVGQAGAEIFRGTGVNMAKGFELNQMYTMQIRQMLSQRDANGNPLLSRETVGQAGGEFALGQQMTANALGSFQSAVGRGALMANYNPTTGQLNPNMLQNMAGQDMMGMMQNAAGLANSPMAIFRLQADQSKLISSLSPQQMQLFSLETGMAEARTILGALGERRSAANMETVYKAEALRRGVSEQVIDTQFAMLHQDPSEIREQSRSAENSMLRQAALEDFRNRFSGKRITNALRETFVQGVQRVGSRIAGAVEQDITDLGIQIAGGNVDAAPMTKSSIERGEQLLRSGGAETLVDARGSFYQRHSLLGNASADSLGDTFNRFGQVHDNTVTYNGSTAQLFKDEASARRAGATGMIIGEHDGKVMVLSSNENKKLTDTMRGLQPTQKARDAVAKEHLKDDIRDKLLDLSEKSGDQVSLTDVASIVTGAQVTDITKLKDQDLARIERYAQATGGALGAQYTAATGTYMSADAASKARSQLSERAASLGQREQELILGSVDKDIGKYVGHFGGGKRSVETLLRGLGADSPDVIAGIASAATDTRARNELRDAAALHGINLSKTDEIGLVSTVRGLSEEKKHQLMKMEDERVKTVAEEQRVSVAATGGKGGDVNPVGAIGDLTKESMQQVRTLSDAIVKNCEIILKMQEMMGINASNLQRRTQ